MDDKGDKKIPARVKRIGTIAVYWVLVASIVFVLANPGMQLLDKLKITETAVEEKSDGDTNDKGETQDKAEDKKTDKKTAKDKTEKAEDEKSSATDPATTQASSNSGNANADKNSTAPSKSVKGKKWVDEPVYEDVPHPEEGHYETLYYCRCYEVDGDTSAVFTSREGWAQHRADFIASNGGVCNGHHRNYRTEDQWVVDRAAWTERVLVSKGHWE